MNWRTASRALPALVDVGYASLVRLAHSLARGPMVWTAARASSSGECPGSATIFAQASVR
ncbi:MAG TPA: hypothetical protein VGP57_03160 [Actinoplanes sp.]|nr:hypothetical protein [Actinoplanes sp.]